MEGDNPGVGLYPRLEITPGTTPGSFSTVPDLSGDSIYYDSRVYPIGNPAGLLDIYLWEYMYFKSPIIQRLSA